LGFICSFSAYELPLEQFEALAQDGGAQLYYPAVFLASQRKKPIEEMSFTDT